MSKNCDDTSVRDLFAPYANPRHRLYGIRQRKLSPAARARILRRLPPLLIDPDRTWKNSAQLRRDCGGDSIDDIIIEIGFGAGEHLATYAQHHPRTLCIGCEPYAHGVSALLRRVESRNIANIRIFPADALNLLARLPPSSITRVFLLFPDPWPKRRHAKRRFIQSASLDLLARIMRPQARLIIASDAPVSIEHTLLHIQPRGDFHWNARQAEDWRRPPTPWIETRYEKKARAEHRPPVYLTFLRQQPPSPAPPGVSAAGGGKK